MSITKVKKTMTLDASDFHKGSQPSYKVHWIHWHAWENGLQKEN